MGRVSVRILAAMLLISAACRDRPAADQPGPAEDAAVLAVDSAFGAALNAGNLEALGRTYDEDALRQPSPSGAGKRSRASGGRPAGDLRRPPDLRGRPLRDPGRSRVRGRSLSHRDQAQVGGGSGSGARGWQVPRGAQAPVRRELELSGGHVQSQRASQVGRFRPPGGPAILPVPQVRRAPAREPRQDLAGSSAKRCPVSLRGA